MKIVSENRFSGKTYFYTIAQDHRQRVHVLGGGEADRGHEEDFALGDPSQGGGQTVRGRYAIFIEYFIEFWYRVVHQIVQGDSPP